MDNSTLEADEPNYLLQINQMSNFVQVGVFEIFVFEDGTELRGTVHAAIKRATDNDEIKAYKEYCKYHNYVVLEFDSADDANLNSPFPVKITLLGGVLPQNVEVDNITLDQSNYEATIVRPSTRQLPQKKIIVSLQPYFDDIWKHTGLFLETEELPLPAFKMKLVANKKLGSAITNALSLVRCRVPHLSNINMEDLTLSQHTSWRYDLQEEVMNQFAHLCALLWRVNNVRDHKQYLQAFWLKDYKAAIEGSISFFKRVHYTDNKWIRAKRTFDWS